MALLSAQIYASLGSYYFQMVKYTQNPTNAVFSLNWKIVSRYDDDHSNECVYNAHLHNSRLEKRRAYTGIPYATDIEMGLYVETICSGHRNGFLRGDHMQWT